MEVSGPDGQEAAALVPDTLLLALLVPVEGWRAAGEKQSSWSLQHPSFWHYFRERAINSPELKKFCFCHGFLAIILLSLAAKRQDFWGNARGCDETLKTQTGV